ncbi:hypothetical protein [Rhizobium halophytocola]|uniref:Oligosaccharide flippase family protein n=1 Tax=Rhizobium halophytocola TaxID=735519 RepID=A0ABS4E0N1_9HYPH|nr:hypothetical protein [Rhizobium halophytocola]MBP1851498.1 hypothetical protein [Rhizobium halophytocola]
MPTASRTVLRRASNVALLVGGYGIGQGSMFIAQTWLLARGELGLLAFFGTSFAFAILAIILVEAGSIIVLARLTVQNLDADPGWQAIWRCYWETSVFRASVAVIVVLAGLFYLAVIGADRQTTGFALCFVPAIAIWAFNGAGLIDGLSLSGLSGLTGSLPYVAAAIGLFIVSTTEPQSYGVILGAGLSIGYGLTVVAHFVILWRLGHRPRLVMPSRYGLRRSFADGLSLISTQAPGQLYFRYQLLLSHWFLGLDGTALFIYGKQIVTAFIQLLTFVRRTEFPGLVARLNGGSGDRIQAIFQEQRLGNYLAFCLFACVACAGAGIYAFGGTTAAPAGFAIAALAPTIFSNTLSLAFNQGLSALGLYPQLVRSTALAMTTGALVSTTLGATLGILGFAIADMLQHVTSLTLNIRTIRHRPPAAASDTR